MLKGPFSIAILFLLCGYFVAAGGVKAEYPDLSSPRSVLPLPVRVDENPGRTTVFEIVDGAGGNGRDTPGGSERDDAGGDGRDTGAAKRVTVPVFDVDLEMQRLFERLLVLRLSELGVDTATARFAVPVNFRKEPGLFPADMESAPRNFFEQGYILDVAPGGIECRAGTEVGMLNGFSTFLQLLQRESDGITAPNCVITDWPDFSTRYVTEYHIPDTGFFDWMALYKINGFATSYRAFKWDDPGERTIAAMSSLGEYIARLGTIKHMVQIHIGGRGGGVLDAGDEDHLEMLFRTITLVVEQGRAAHIMICHDDITPKLKGRETDIFESPAHAHIHLLERIEEFLAAGYPEVELSFVTPYYRGFQHKSWRSLNTASDALRYMKTLRSWNTSKTAIVWTGPNTESFKITATNIRRYRRLVGEDKELIYWDNTWHRSQPLRSFAAEYPDGFVDECYNGIALINIFATRPIGRFFASTAMDYYWSSQGFDPVRSRRVAVSRFMGPEAVGPAEHFFDYRGSSYYSSFMKGADTDHLRDIFMRMRAASEDKRLADYCLDEVERFERTGN